MTEPEQHSLETILRQIAAAAPAPWYPADHARETGVLRDSLDTPLERLRLGGLIRLTDWESGRGQGYALTPKGSQALEDPRHMAQVRDGRVPELHVAAEVQPLPQGPLSAFERGEEVRRAMLEPRQPVFTKPLIALNVLVFVAGAFVASANGVSVNAYLSDTADPNDFAQMMRLGAIYQKIGGLNGSNVVHGEWWRLLTTCFVHRGLMHIAMNMYALYVLGMMAERLWGPGRFLLLYLLAGIGGSCAAMMASPGGCVGASGAICGILGGEAAWLWLNRGFLPPPVVAGWTRALVINTVLIAVISSFPGVSGAGHLGGAVTGLVVAFLINVHRFGTSAQRWLAVLGLLAVPAAGVGLVVRTMHESPEWKAFLVEPKSDSSFKKYVNDINQTRQALVVCTEEAVPLLQQHPQRRDAAAVLRVRAALTAQQQGRELLAKRLEQQPPYRDPKIEAYRQQSLETVTAAAQTCAAYELALQGGPNGPANEKAATQQFEQAKQLWNHWVEEGQRLGVLE